MAYRNPNGIEQVKLKNLRECHHYLATLSKYNEYGPSKPFPEDKKVCEPLINQIIQSLPSNFSMSYIINLLSELEHSARNNLLPDSDFEWLDAKNDRLIYIVWFHLRVSELTPMGPQPQSQHSLQYRPLLQFIYTSEASAVHGLYNYVSDYPNPTSTKERLKAIINFFDNFNMNIISKHELLLCLKGYCQHILSDSNSVKWLSKDNSVQAVWAWDYMLSAWVTNDILKPMNNIERINATIVTFDFWRGHPAEKEVYLIKMKKAWSQKKHRDGLVGKKAYNITMSNEIQGMLEALSIRSDSKINRTLERIIRQEYAKIAQK